MTVPLEDTLILNGAGWQCKCPKKKTARVEAKHLIVYVTTKK